MIPALAVATLAAWALTARTDTTFSVGPESRLEIENFAGDVAISTWGRNAVRIEADHSARTIVEIEHDGPTVSVRPRSRRGAHTSVDLRITAPATAALEVNGVYADVTVEGAKADVAVETVRGDVRVTGGAGRIALQSVEGEVVLEGGRGRAELSSVNAGVTVRGYEGELAAETVNGEIVLEDLRGGAVEASTVNGDVRFDGEIRSGGRYRFATHNGDITVTLPAQPSVSVSVATFGGEFESSFPVKVTSTHRGRRIRFTLGSGQAGLDLESFQGTIRLQRRGEAGPARVRERAVEQKKEFESREPNPDPPEEEQP